MDELRQALQVSALLAATPTTQTLANAQERLNSLLAASSAGKDDLYNATGRAGLRDAPCLTHAEDAHTAIFGMRSHIEYMSDELRKTRGVLVEWWTDRAGPYLAAPEASLELPQSPMLSRNGTADPAEGLQAHYAACAQAAPADALGKLNQIMRSALEGCERFDVDELDFALRRLNDIQPELGKAATSADTARGKFRNCSEWIPERLVNPETRATRAQQQPWSQTGFTPPGTPPGPPASGPNRVQQPRQW